MRSLGWVLILVLTPTAATSQEVRLDGIIVTEYGLYDRRITGKVKAESTAIGHLLIVTDRKLTAATDVVCARLGVTFGFQYRLLGKPVGAGVLIEAVTQFPPQGMVNAKGERFARNTYTWPDTIGDTGSRTFTFEEPWEMVPGVWSFEFHYLGRKIGEQRFTIEATCPVS